MRFMSVLVLLTGLAIVSRGGPTKPEPAEPAVPVVKDAVEGFAFKQVTSATPHVVSETPAPVSILESGLPHVRKFSKRPVIAMSESKDWFFYATSVARDKNGRPKLFLSGYAIQRDGRQVIGWSVW
jgi:hypothetical protein